MSFNVGENVGPYRVIEQLGQGGMATVYKAYHAALDRYVALKVLHPAFGEDPNFAARFQREARLVAKLDHPNIVPIYDYSEHEKRTFLVMKFIEGETLKARMARGPLASDELAKIIEAVGSALAYAHKMGILHRDIKPSNVLLVPDGSIYLADFGLARIASAGESTLSGDMIMGTPQYISPEQAMGKKDLDEGTDIYSFGVMLYEMVVGQVPFNADTPFSIIHDHIYTSLPIPHTINPGVPEPVERVLLKALSKERADRYASVTEMADAFKQAWLSAGVPMKGTTITMPPQVAPVSAKPAPAAEMVAPAEPKAKKKRPRWMVIAGAILLFLCCLFAFFAVRRGGLFPSPNQAAATQTARQSAIATIVASSATASTNTPPFDSPPLLPPLPGTRSLIDDFEGASPAGTAGWEAFFDETTDTKITCAANSDSPHAGAKSLLFQFDVVADSWATCGFYFDSVQNWDAGQGLSFYLRADRAGLPFHVDLYGGSPGATITYYHEAETSQGSVEGWTLMEIRWADILRAEWEENPGTPFPPKEVTGFSIGLSTEGTERTSGMIRLDDLALLDSPASAPGDNLTAEIQDALKGVDQKPDDPFAHLRLALAYWDAGQSRLAYVSLAKAADLAGGDAGFFMRAGNRFVEREAWVAAAIMYQRAVLAQAGGEIPANLLDAYHEAVYKAVDRRDVLLYLPFAGIANVDQPMAYIAEGRFHLLRGNNVKAREFLERARQIKPTLPEVTLLDAEISFKEGNQEQARGLLDELMSNPDTPEWIRALADTYLIPNP